MNPNPSKVVVVKMNIQHEETWRYEGRILARDANSLLIQAFFNRDDLPFHGVTLKRNDRFIERYYDDRWYNIFEIHDREDDHLKAWYCNVTTPAEFTPGKIAYVDLALDVLSYPDGQYLVLDRDEFAALPLDQETRKNACQALDELENLAKTGGLAQVFK